MMLASLPTSLRGNLFALLGYAHDPEIVYEAKCLIAQMFRDKIDLDSSMTGAAFNIATQNGDPTLYTLVRKAYS